MRNLNFRDNVLWNLAYRIGLDPAKEFLVDQASALATYINSWVRRIYDSQDWPEWTKIRPFTPINHIINWESLPSDYDDNTDTLNTTRIGRVLKVYLIDPETTIDPVETPFREDEIGVHVGFDHGTTVWLKYLPRTPQYTSDFWDATRSYNLDDLTYSPTTGECYISLVSGNIGNDPSLIDHRHPLPPQTLQPWTPTSQGIPTAIPQISDLKFLTLDGTAIPDPPSASSEFVVWVLDGNGVAIDHLFYTPNGTDSLATVITNIMNGLIALPSLSAFTFSQPTTMSIQFQADQVFQLDGLNGQPYYNDPTTGSHRLRSAQVQAYVASSSAISGQPQVTSITIPQSSIVPGTTFSITFIDTGGAPHTVQYVATSTDSGGNIVIGLANAITAASGADDFFLNVSSVVDVTTLTLTLSLSLPASVNSDYSIANQWWEFIPFPFMLVDPVVRGSYSDALKEMGQHDKAGAEEQAVSQESSVRASSNLAPAYDQLTDQKKPAGRYA